MSTPTRTFRNIRKIGIKNYLIQMWYIGDTKYGQLVGVDKSGNKYYQNNEELPLRTRWVDYKRHDYDAASIEPGWHAWMSYMTDKYPNADPIMSNPRPWALDQPISNGIWTRAAYKPYNTTKPKVESVTWTPVAAPREGVDS